MSAPHKRSHRSSGGRGKAHPKGTVAKAVAKIERRVLGAVVARPRRQPRPQRVRPAPSRRSGLPVGVSLVSDGVNSGSVWKNSSAESVTFPICREKISDITTTSTAFVIQNSLYLNPGNTSLFPIFSLIAANYEQFRCNHLRFYFRTEAYMASGTVVSAGLVGMATNFDPDDAAFTEMTQLENYAHSESGAPFTGVFCHDVIAHRRKRAKYSNDPSMALKSYYVYSSANQAAPSTSTSKFYDLGLFQQACSGCQTGILGELWVEYGFTMINRKQQTPLGQSLLTAHYKDTGTDCTAAAPFGAPSMVSQAGSNIGLTFTSTTFVLPVVYGRFVCQIYWYGSGIAAIPGLSATNGASLVGYLRATNNASSAGFFTAAGTAAADIFLIDVVGGGTITISGLTSMTGASCDVYVTQTSSGLTHSRPTIAGLEDKLNRLARRLESIGLSPEPSFREPCSPDEFKTTDCVVADLKTCSNCRDSAALIGSIYCYRCAQAIGARRGLKVAWNPDS
jgi:hypothetical protein